MQKESISNDINLMKNNMLKKLVGEKDVLINELVSENNVLKRTIRELDNRFKHVQMQLETIQKQNNASQSTQSRSIESFSEGRFSTETRVMNEIHSIRKDFLDLMKVMNTNNSNSSNHTPNIIYAGPYGGAGYQMPGMGIGMPMMHQMPQMAGMQIQGAQMQGMGNPYMFGQYPQQMQNQSFNPNNQSGNSGNHNNQKFSNPKSSPPKVSRAAEKAVSIKDLLKNRPPAPPPAPPMSSSNGGSAGTDSTESKGSMAMVIAELKSVLNRKKEASEPNEE